MWLVCDYGCVLSLPQPSEAVAALATTAGFDNAEQFIGLYWKDRLAYDRGDLVPDQYWTAVIGVRPTESQLRDLDRQDVKSWQHPNLEAVEQIRTLGRAGYRLAMLSNAPVGLARAIPHLEWIPPFERYFFSSDMRMVKPDGRIFNAILAQLQAEPQDVLFVDDRLDNIEAAREIGIRVIHFESAGDLAAIDHPKVAPQAKV